jgi:hypothetical protein
MCLDLKIPTATR